MRRTILTITAAALALAAGFFASRRASAEDKPELQVSAQQSLHDVAKLAQQNDVQVYVNVAGGTQYAGRVKEAGAGAVVLTRVTGKDFYDVYIPIDQLVSIELRVRNR